MHRVSANILVISFSLLVSIVVGCASTQTSTSQPTFVAAVGTNTSVPTSTATVTQTSTPTITPAPTTTPTVTPSPTPIPTIPGLSLQGVTYPDEQLLGAVTKAYANALTLQPEHIRISYTTFKDGLGNYFVFAYDISGGIPLLVAKKQVSADTYIWEQVGLKILAEMNNIKIGTVLDLNKGNVIQRLTEIYGKDFDAANVQYDTDWNNIEPQQGTVIFTNTPKWAFADRDIEFANDSGMFVLGAQFFWPVTYPEWLTKGDFTPEQLANIVIKHISDLTNRYKGKVGSWNVLNEYFPVEWGLREDLLQRKIGRARFLLLAFETASQLDPNALLTLNNDKNETLNSPNYQLTKQDIDTLRAAGIQNLTVGMQMHLDGTNPPGKEDVIRAMQSYGVPVLVTEFDVNLKDVDGTDQQRFSKQAQIYKNMLEACLDSGVCKVFLTFQIGDKYSWLESDPENAGIAYSPFADPTIYDNNLRPKPAYYAMLGVLFHRLISIAPLNAP